MSDVISPHRVACHECDLLIDVPALAPDQVARCARCGATLYRNPADCLDTTLSLSFASLFLYVVANTFPFLAFGSGSNMRQTSLFSGVLDLHHQGMTILAIVVFITSLLLPAFKILGQIYVLLPLRLGRRAPAMEEIFRWLLHTRAWSMMEIFLLGILVAFVKLAGMAEIVPGVALWAFGCLVVTLAWSSAKLEPRVVWDRAEALR